ncbi:probable 7-methylxanthine methyltransferase PCS2 isoform X2 [Cornus florida]|uniref:probable 7-methylxanthine methyltransferase PCS2 isoform X2 n=1 Tax=Cornus florida TaxID=4283 RepID=UPI002896E626|nr:probable 7-methylxanthine methyltransferase PCS2 isoform X2 [Cornus florida]XP_059666389.1 probable 7-methylxanthine methyltransferase PCS2 isoform X2 [Cornus florida]
MEKKQALDMNRGGGESSYSQNSKFQQKRSSITKPILENSVQSLISKGFHLHKLLNVVDLGCSTGPNTFSVIQTVKETVEKKCKELNCQTPEIQFYLNDLPGNDFNSLFKGLSGFCDQTQGESFYAAGVPGSFHGRLFPRNTLHFVHSSCSLHFLSQVPKGLTSNEGLPLNKGKVYISTTSPPVVREAYLTQFQEDFTLFLKSRSEELVPDGCIFFTIRGSADPTSKDCCWQWELFAEAIAELVSEGLVEEGKLDSFNLAYYLPSPEEVQDIVEKEGSFAIEHLETFSFEIGDKQEKDTWSQGEKFANSMRFYTESLISHHFGEEIVDKLFQKTTRLLVEELAKETIIAGSILVVLSRILG